jgi:sodium ion-translocating decarboxylase beta subunit
VPADAGLWVYGGFLLAVGLALGLGWLAVVYRLQPVFLLPLAVGVLLAAFFSPPGAGFPAAFFQVLHTGLDSGLFVALIFLGWGAGANLSYLVARPVKLLLGLIPPLALFATYHLAVALGLTPGQGATAALIGGGDGLSVAFLASRVSPEILGPACLAAFTLVGLQFWCQPALMRLVTSRQERLQPLPLTRKVTRRENLLFAVAGLILTLLLVPRATLLTGMFFLGCIIKESGVMDRLARTLANRLAEIMSLLLGLAVGSRCAPTTLFSLTFLKIILTGLVGLMLATLVVTLTVKVMNIFRTQKLNPWVGAAALGWVPDAAHLVQVLGRQEDPHVNIYPHALAVSQAALLGATLTAGLLWSILAGN